MRNKKDWKNFEKNNIKIVLNVLYAKKEKHISCLCFRTELQSSKTVLINAIGKVLPYLGFIKAISIIKKNAS